VFRTAQPAFFVHRWLAESRMPSEQTRWVSGFFCLPEINKNFFEKFFKGATALHLWVVKLI
jgi:hypothetical protein